MATPSSILNSNIAKVQQLTAAVSASNARLITNNNFKYIDSAITAIINSLGIDGGPTLHVNSATVSGQIVGRTFRNAPGSFTVNGMGQIHAAGGINTPLAHISRLRLDPDRTISAIQAGEFRWSGSDFLGWDGTEWLSFTSGNGSLKLTQITYAELVTAIGASTLVPGDFYEITDYRTVHYIQWTGSALTSPPYISGEEINVGPIEPLIVQASGTSTVFAQAISAAYPQDYILYSPVGWVDRDRDSVFQGLTQSTGIILKRIDTLRKLERDYDWRAFVFRRWETVPGNGIYRSVHPVPKAAHQDMTPFDTTGLVEQSDIYIGSNEVLLSLLLPHHNVPYYADNFTLLCNAGGCRISTAYCGTIDATQSFFMNTITTWYMNDINGVIDVNDINILAVSNVQGGMQNNTINQFTNSTITGAVSTNIVGTVQNTVVGRDFSGNICQSVQNCTVTNNLKTNTSEGIANCTAGDITHNNVNNITNNNLGSYLIRNNTGQIIQNCTNGGDILNNTVYEISNLSHSGGLANATGGSIGYIAGAVDLNAITFNVLQDVVMDAGGPYNIYNHSFNTTHQDLIMTPTADMGNFDIPTQSSYDKGSSGYSEIWYNMCSMNCTSISSPLLAPFLDIVFASVKVNYANLWTEIAIYTSTDNVHWTLEASSSIGGPWPTGSGLWDSGLTPILGTYYQARASDAFGTSQTASKQYLPSASSITISDLGLATASQVAFSYVDCYTDVTVWLSNIGVGPGAPPPVVQVGLDAPAFTLTPNETGTGQIIPVGFNNGSNYFVQSHDSHGDPVTSDLVTYTGPSVHIDSAVDAGDGTTNYQLTIAEGTGTNTIGLYYSDSGLSGPWIYINGGTNQPDGTFTPNIPNPGAGDVFVVAQLMIGASTYFTEPSALTWSQAPAVTLLAIGPNTFAAQYWNVSGPVFLYSSPDGITWSILTADVNPGSYPATGTGSSTNGGGASPGYYYRVQSIDADSNPIISNSIVYQFAEFNEIGMGIDSGNDELSVDAAWRSIYSDILINMSSDNSTWSQVADWSVGPYPSTQDFTSTDVPLTIPYNYYQITSTDGDGNIITGQLGQLIPHIQGLGKNWAVENGDGTTTYNFKVYSGNLTNNVYIEYSTDGMTWISIWSAANLTDGVYTQTVSNATVGVVKVRAHLNVPSTGDDYYVKEAVEVPWNVPAINNFAVTDNGDNTSTYSFNVVYGSGTNSINPQFSTDDGATWTNIFDQENVADGPETVTEWANPQGGTVMVRIMLTVAAIPYYATNQPTITWTSASPYVVVNNITDNGFGSDSIQFTTFNTDSTNSCAVQYYDGSKWQTIGTITNWPDNSANWYDFQGWNLTGAPGIISFMVVMGAKYYSNMASVTVSQEPLMTINSATPSGTYGTETDFNITFNNWPGTQTIGMEYSTDGGSTWTVWTNFNPAVSAGEFDLPGNPTPVSGTSVVLRSFVVYNGKPYYSPNFDATSFATGNMTFDSAIDNGDGTSTYGFTVYNIDTASGTVEVQYSTDSGATWNFNYSLAGLSNGSGTLSNVTNLTSGAVLVRLALGTFDLNVFYYTDGTAMTWSPQPHTIVLNSATDGGGSTEWNFTTTNTDSSNLVQPQWSTDGGVSYSTEGYGWTFPTPGEKTAFSPNPTTGLVWVRLSMTTNAGTIYSNAMTETWS